MMELSQMREEPVEVEGPLRSTNRRLALVARNYLE